MTHVLDHPAAAPDTAAAHFTARLAFETDCSDVHQTLQTDPGAGAVFVTYCWGPHCNGADRAAARIATAGFQVKVMVAP